MTVGAHAGRRRSSTQSGGAAPRAGPGGLVAPGEVRAGLVVLGGVAPQLVLEGDPAAVAARGDGDGVPHGRHPLVERGGGGLLGAMATAASPTHDSRRAKSRPSLLPKWS